MRSYMHICATTNRTYQDGEPMQAVTYSAPETTDLNADFK